MAATRYQTSEAIPTDTAWLSSPVCPPLRNNWCTPTYEPTATARASGSEGNKWSRLRSPHTVRTIHHPKGIPTAAPARMTEASPSVSRRAAAVTMGLSDNLRPARSGMGKTWAATNATPRPRAATRVPISAATVRPIGGRR